VSDDIPGHWMPDLERRGLTSYRKLGAAAGVSHETARRVIHGRQAKDDTIQAIATAIGVTPTRIYELRGQVEPDRSRDWQPPASAALLTAEEREALSRLITLMTREREGSGGDGNAASMTAGSFRLDWSAKPQPDIELLVDGKPAGTIEVKTSIGGSGAPTVESRDFFAVLVRHGALERFDTHMLPAPLAKLDRDKVGLVAQAASGISAVDVAVTTALEDAVRLVESRPLDQIVIDPGVPARDS